MKKSVIGASLKQIINGLGTQSPLTINQLGALDYALYDEAYYTKRYELVMKALIVLGSYFNTLRLQQDLQTLGNIERLSQAVYVLATYSSVNLEDFKDLMLCLHQDHDVEDLIMKMDMQIDEYIDFIDVDELMRGAEQGLRPFDEKTYKAGKASLFSSDDAVFNPGVSAHRKTSDVFNKPSHRWTSVDGLDNKTIPLDNFYQEPENTGVVPKEPADVSYNGRLLFGTNSSSLVIRLNPENVSLMTAKAILDYLINISIKLKELKDLMEDSTPSFSMWKAFFGDLVTVNYNPESLVTTIDELVAITGVCYTASHPVFGPVLSLTIKPTFSVIDAYRVVQAIARKIAAAYPSVYEQDEPNLVARLLNVSIDYWASATTMATEPKHNPLIVIEVNYAALETHRSAATILINFLSKFLQDFNQYIKSDDAVINLFHLGGCVPQFLRNHGAMLSVIKRDAKDAFLVEVVRPTVRYLDLRFYKGLSNDECVNSLEEAIKQLSSWCAAYDYKNIGVVGSNSVPIVPVDQLTRVGQVMMTPIEFYVSGNASIVYEANKNLVLKFLKDILHSLTMGLIKTRPFGLDGNHNTIQAIDLNSLTQAIPETVKIGEQTMNLSIFQIKDHIVKVEGMISTPDVFLMRFNIDTTRTTINDLKNHIEHKIEHFDQCLSPAAQKEEAVTTDIEVRINTDVVKADKALAKLVEVSLLRLLTYLTHTTVVAFPNGVLDMGMLSDHCSMGTAWDDKLVLNLHPNLNVEDGKLHVVAQVKGQNSHERNPSYSPYMIFVRFGAATLEQLLTSIEKAIKEVAALRAEISGGNEPAKLTAGPDWNKPSQPSVYSTAAPRFVMTIQGHKQSVVSAFKDETIACLTAVKTAVKISKSVNEKVFDDKVVEEINAAIEMLSNEHIAVACRKPHNYSGYKIEIAQRFNPSKPLLELLIPAYSSLDSLLDCIKEGISHIQSGLIKFDISKTEEIIDVGNGLLGFTIYSDVVKAKGNNSLTELLEALKEATIKHPKYSTFRCSRRSLNEICNATTVDVNGFQILYLETNDGNFILTLGESQNGGSVAMKVKGSHITGLVKFTEMLDYAIMLSKCIKTDAETSDDVVDVETADAIVTAEQTPTDAENQTNELLDGATEISEVPEIKEAVETGIHPTIERSKA